MYINNNVTKNNFNGISALARPLATFYNPNAILPTLVIESGVTGGRTAMAYKRGGKMEATERFVEQGISAIVWLWGVQALKKIGDKVGEKLLKLNLNFDVGYDYLRNPIKNNKISNLAKGFKMANMFTSVALSTYFIGFVLPKINHKISKKYAPQKPEKPVIPATHISMESFLNKINNNNSKNISFASLNAVALAHTLENNQTARLLITDSGVVAGRCKNSRNKYERIESLFRDISSIYFYLFSTKHFVGLMNKCFKNTDIQPKTLEYLKDELLTHQDTNINSFAKNAFKPLTDKNATKLKELFKNKTRAVNVDDFIKLFPDFTQKAKEMAKLQPIFNGNGVLSYKQAQDVLSSGWLTNPEFLQKMANVVTNGASSDKMRFVSANHLEQIRESAHNFVEQIGNYATKNNKSIDEKLIENVTNKNIRKNFSFYIMGTAFSIFALSYIIPKVQYFITKKLTNENKFPGASTQNA